MAARRDAVLSLGPSLRSALDDYLVWLGKQPAFVIEDHEIPVPIDRRVSVVTVDSLR